MSEIVIQNVKKTYGDVHAVRKVDLSLEKGEFLTILGPSGCGKTTTLRMIAGFISPTEGQILFAGRDVTNLPAHKREVGLVFQNYALFPHMSVKQNVAFGLKMRGCSNDEMRSRVGEALELVQLQKLANRMPQQLSGGQQQRVALARALVIRPKLLLLDEPFGALDRQLRDHMRIELRSLQKTLNLPTVFVTHDQEEALAMSDRVVVMYDGGVEQIGTPTDVYERPGTEFVASFLGRSNVISFDVENSGTGGSIGRRGKLRVDFKVPPASNPAVVMIRPERISVRKSVGAPSETNEGSVKVVSYLGASTESIVDLGGVTLEVRTPNLGSDVFTPQSGDRVIVDIPADAIWPLKNN